MRIRIAAVIVTACLCSTTEALRARMGGTATAQNAAPNLTRSQRDLLKAIVSAVDAAAHPETADLQWQHHVLRASDGSHYVAFSAQPPAAAALPPGPVLLYVRLATATSGATRVAERSAIREWLAGSRTDPRLLPRTGIAVGEMPIMGPTGNFGVRQPVSTGSNELKLMALERERAKQEQDERDKQRRARLEGFEAATDDALPFEDFDLASKSVNRDGARIITRALTAGPGNYDLFLAWADPSSPKPGETIRVVRKAIALEPARTSGLITSGVILADAVNLRREPYSPAEQASHPYSIGAMEIVPARSARYAPQDNLALAVQVINAQPTDAGMPDLTVNFRIVKVNGDRESPVASLHPQSYNAATMPAGFNLRAGHPIFAAVTAPLATLTRGDYRVKIVANDRLVNSNATTEVDFTVIGTPASLLAEAPPLGLPFRREAVLDPSVLGPIVDALTPASPSPPLTRALAIARTGKPADLLVEEPVPQSEEGVRTALRGLALLAVGDGSSAVQFQRAQLLGAPMAPSRFLSGAARAMQLRDADAIAGWQEALAAGAPRSMVAPFLAEAYLRRKDYERAAGLLDGGATTAWSRSTAAVLIAARKEMDAVKLIDARLAAAPGDSDAQWLLLHALFARIVADANAPANLRERFAKQARAYIDAKGAHAAVAEEWLKVISSV
jgi:hypothetical protein